MNNAEVQAVQIISESPRHLWQSGILTLRDKYGQEVRDSFREAVIVVRAGT